MDQQQNVQNHFGYPESIGKIGPGFCLVKEFNHSANPEIVKYSKLVYFLIQGYQLAYLKILLILTITGHGK